MSAKNIAVLVLLNEQYVLHPLPIIDVMCIEVYQQAQIWYRGGRHTSKHMVKTYLNAGRHTRRHNSTIIDMSLFNATSCFPRVIYRHAVRIPR